MPSVYINHIILRLSEMLNIVITINLITLVLIVLVSGQNDNYVLLISYDAFRPDYFERDVTPFMNDLRKKGTYAEYMRNVFPTKTFTNHHTISTGLFPEVHGVLGVCYSFHYYNC